MEAYNKEFKVVENNDSQIQQAVNDNYERYYVERKPNIEALKKAAFWADTQGSGNYFGINV